MFEWGLAFSDVLGLCGWPTTSHTGFVFSYCSFKTSFWCWFKGAAGLRHTSWLIKLISQILGFWPTSWVLPKCGRWTWEDNEKKHLIFLKWYVLLLQECMVNKFKKTAIRKLQTTTQMEAAQITEKDLMEGKFYSWLSILSCSLRLEMRVNVKVVFPAPSASLQRGQKTGCLALPKPNCFPLAPSHLIIFDT